MAVQVTIHFEPNMGASCPACYSAVEEGNGDKVCGLCGIAFQYQDGAATVDQAALYGRLHRSD